MAALYIAPVSEFLGESAEHLVGALTIGLAKEGFDTSAITTLSWQEEVGQLQTGLRNLIETFPAASQWSILLEYVLPIVGQRVDCVLLADDLVLVIEYKGGTSATARAALRQAQDYAMNLTDFHEESRGRTVVPIAVGQFKALVPLDLNSRHQGAAVSPAGLCETVGAAFHAWSGNDTPISPPHWNASRYFPVPTIIEAASEVYRDHDVKDLAFSRSGSDNLETTQQAIADSVRDARGRGVKKLILVTGVPGAGKTLAGLNAVQRLQPSLDLATEHASFLSGNGPLVAVLQEALKRSIGRRKRGVARSVQSRIRDVHRFVRDSYGDTRAPADRLIVFDEAQRAWTAAKNKKKFGRDVSEPAMILEIMERHVGWAAVVALIGGGQEIHGGEAGLAAWGDAIVGHDGWEVVTSPEAIRGGPSVAGSRLFRPAAPFGSKVVEDSALHLSVSKRSHQTTVTAAWVNAILEGRQVDASDLSLRGLPIYLTRDLDEARRWLRGNSVGKRRAGLIASSGAARLRAEGVEAPTFSFLGGIDYTKWFLEPEGDHRSSNQLEVALSEFEMQGLELDMVGLLWGGDLVFRNGVAVCRSLKGRTWDVMSGTGDPQESADDRRTRILNKYRVLLTRFRKAMVIFVPKGSGIDSTQASNDFDGVHEYLAACGTRSLPVSNS